MSRTDGFGHHHMVCVAAIIKDNLPLLRSHWDKRGDFINYYLGRDAGLHAYNYLTLALRQAKDNRVREWIVAADPGAVNRLCSDGNTPLAGVMGRKKAVAYLLEHGADIHARDNEGLTPLYRFCSSFITDVLPLLARGANEHEKAPNGKTALDQAIRYGHLQLPVLLNYRKLIALTHERERGKFPLQMDIIRSLQPFLYRI
jgi:ankyrin repeat protein